MKISEEQFVSENGRTLSDYLTRMVHDEGINLPDAIRTNGTKNGAS